MEKTEISECDILQPCVITQGCLNRLCPLSDDLLTKWVDKPCINFSICVFPLQWVGSSCGLHGPYIFYKAFKFNRDGKPRILSLGDFFFVRCKPEDPICIAELQLLWEERTSKQLLSSSKLYFLPEDTPQGRTVTHGEVGILIAWWIIRNDCCFLVFVLPSLRAFLLNGIFTALRAGSGCVVSGGRLS